MDNNLLASGEPQGLQAKEIELREFDVTAMSAKGLDIPRVSEDYFAKRAFDGSEPKHMDECFGDEEFDSGE